MVIYNEEKVEGVTASTRVCPGPPSTSEVVVWHFTLFNDEFRDRQEQELRPRHATVVRCGLMGG